MFREELQMCFPPKPFCATIRSPLQPGITGAMHPNRLVDPEDSSWDAYIWVEDADALYDEFQRKGITIVRPICDQPYNCRDFDIQDCNGDTLCFGHIL